ncbi:uncharacterized protein LOC124827632 [Vigna umbellata]|uniref:uncharacterized protein LOC124827632 n=1 Tax=Vigna umbellata TaxID=87088 RepID=UPI001F5F1C90|nr:uncharacterized protein LOC124827632 [Vigna umbellata]
MYRLRVLTYAEFSVDLSNMKFYSYLMCREERSETAMENHSNHLVKDTVRTRSNRSVEPLLEGLETSRRPRRSRLSREPSLERISQAVQSDQESMDNNGARRTLADYATVVGPHYFNSIAKPRVNAASMEMKLALIHLVKSNQFNGMSNESPYENLTTLMRSTKLMLDASARGNIRCKTPDEAYELIENMAIDDKRVLQLQSYDALLAQNKIITQQLEVLTKKLSQPPKECRNVSQKTLPPKFKDPGSFTIPCTIKNYDIRKALVDLAASINLMPLSMLKKIDGLEVKPTKTILQMVDRSIKHPYGVVEDVVVKIDKL